jgi:hypothetical protein
MTMRLHLSRQAHRHQLAIRGGAAHLESRQLPAGRFQGEKIRESIPFEVRLFGSEGTVRAA